MAANDEPKTLAELTEVLKSAVAPAGGLDYNTSAEAMVTCAVAAFNWAANQVGPTGFQASWAALKVYGEIMSIDGPFMIMKAEDGLYPQYDLLGRVMKWLDQDDMRTYWADEADKKLQGDLTFVHPDVLAHWKALSGQRPAEAS